MLCTSSIPLYLFVNFYFATQIGSSLKTLEYTMQNASWDHFCKRFNLAQLFLRRKAKYTLHYLIIKVTV